MDQKKIYIIQCANGKYFIGSSAKNGKDNVIDHFSKNISEWLCQHPPIDIIGVITDIDHFDEDKYTKIYMKKFGVDNVRGGSYIKTTLPKFQIDAINVELSTASGACFICKKQDHLMYNCPQESEKN